MYEYILYIRIYVNSYIHLYSFLLKNKYGSSYIFTLHLTFVTINSRTYPYVKTYTPMYHLMTLQLFPLFLVFNINSYSAVDCHLFFTLTMRNFHPHQLSTLQITDTKPVFVQPLSHV